MSVLVDGLCREVEAGVGARMSISKWSRSHQYVADASVS